MTDLTEESLIKAIEDIKKLEQETGEKISIKPKYFYFLPCDMKYEQIKEISDKSNE